MNAETSTRARGRAAELRARHHLEAAGLEILDSNVELAGAEVDLVASEGDAQGLTTVVFVEVRSRADDRRGHPLETVDARKRRQVRRCATAWLVRRELWERVAVRFDVVTLVADELEWLRDAF